MSKDLFIGHACALYDAQRAFGDAVSWLGPYDFIAGACYNWALWGGVQPPVADLSQAVGQLRLTNSKPNRREMVRRFMNDYPDHLVPSAYTGDDDPSWSAQNQLFICSATAEDAHGAINWSHWWIEIRNIVRNGWTGPEHLLLETVPGKALTVRRGQEAWSYKDESAQYVLEVAMPVAGLTVQHYATMSAIHAASLAMREAEFPRGYIGEDRQEFLYESNLWTQLSQQHGQPRLVARITPPNGYVRPTLRGNAAPVLAGGSIVFSDGSQQVVQ